MDCKNCCPYEYHTCLDVDGSFVKGIIVYQRDQVTGVSQVLRYEDLNRNRLTYSAIPQVVNASECCGCTPDSCFWLRALNHTGLTAQPNLVEYFRFEGLFSGATSFTITDSAGTVSGSAPLVDNPLWDATTPACAIYQTFIDAFNDAATDLEISCTFGGPSFASTPTAEYEASFQLRFCNSRSFTAVIRRQQGGFIDETITIAHDADAQNLTYTWRETALPTSTAGYGATNCDQTFAVSEGPVEINDSTLFIE